MVIAAVTSAHHATVSIVEWVQGTTTAWERQRRARSGVGAREADRAAPVCGWVGGVAADRGELRPVDIARGGGDARPWSERLRSARWPLATALRGASAGRARASAWWARSRRRSEAPTAVPRTGNLLGRRNERQEGSQALRGQADRALRGLGPKGRVWIRSGCRSPVSSTDSPGADMPWQRA